MRLLLFVARVAFICNLFFAVCLLMLYTHIGVSQKVESFVIIIGWILSVLFNLLFVSGFFIVLLRRKRTAIHWLITSFNMLCLPFQIFFIFFLNR